MNDDGEYEWLPEMDGGWTADPREVGGRKCSHPGCPRTAVAMFYRPAYRSYGQRARAQRCCDLTDHLYGRRIRDGVVEYHYRVGSPAYIRAKQAFVAATTPVVPQEGDTQ